MNYFQGAPIYNSDRNLQMYTALAKHGGMSLTMKCKGDLWIDDHHTADMSISFIDFWPIVLMPICHYRIAQSL